MATKEDIYQLVNEHFGEERVDITKEYIMIYYPEVTVTNERNRSIDITKLYVKIPMCSNGTMRGIFTMNRTEYTEVQYSCDYMHSHISGIPTYDHTRFLEPCLGRGPIRGTISSLCINIDLDLWRLFCVELDLFVQTESLKGVPYRRLENVGAYNDRSMYLSFRQSLSTTSFNCCIDSNTIKDIVDSFITFLVKKEINTIYDRGIIRFGYSNHDFYILMSNYFIEWFNSRPSSYRQDNIEAIQRLLTKCVSINNSLYRTGRVFFPPSNEGTEVLTFKGEVKYLTITDKIEDTDNSILILDAGIISYIYNTFIKTLNINYGKNRTNKAVYIL